MLVEIFMDMESTFLLAKIWNIKDSSKMEFKMEGVNSLKFYHLIQEIMKHTRVV